MKKPIRADVILLLAASIFFGSPAEVKKLNPLDIKYKSKIIPAAVKRYGIVTEIRLPIFELERFPAVIPSKLFKSPAVIANFSML